jgi:hypothetical protein
MALTSKYRSNHDELRQDGRQVKPATFEWEPSVHRTSDTATTPSRVGPSFTFEIPTNPYHRLSYILF